MVACMAGKVAHMGKSQAGNGPTQAGQPFVFCGSGV